METRRAFLALGAGGLAALAGCTALGGDSGGGDGDGTGGTAGDSPTPTVAGSETDGTPESGGGTGATPTGTPGALGGHPAAAGLADQPALGPDPATRTCVRA